MSRRLALAALALAAVGLSGCITLFPKAEPAQLYRFEAAGPPAGTSAGPTFGVLKLTTGFTRAAATDRILTVGPGGDAAYIAGARWVAPAAVIFDEQVARVFQAGGRARLISRGEIIRADYALKLDVNAFEVRYDHGPKAAPTVVVDVRAVMNRTQDRVLVGEESFTASIRAGDNRVSAIVPAFNQALGQVLGEVVAWVDAGGAKGPA